MNLQWAYKAFNNFTVNELYEVMRLRSAVFVVEQNCVYNDFDGKDAQSYHVTATNTQGNVLAYTRLLPIGLAYQNYCSIGRVLTALQARQLGLGKQLMEYSITTCYTLFGRQPIKIGAQIYLLKFYESFGFKVCSNVYLEDGIKHVEMLLP